MIKISKDLKAIIPPLSDNGTYKTYSCPVSIDILLKSISKSTQIDLND